MPRFHFSVSQRYALALISVLVLVLTAAGGIFWYSRAMATASYGPAGAPPAATADASADDTQGGTGILLGLARDAMRDGRLVAPAGSNAYEFYLSVLQLEPQNPTAQQALRESFPRAAKSICCASSTATTSPSPCSAASSRRRAIS